MKWEEPSVMILAGLLLMQVIAGVVGNGTPRTHPYSILNDPQADRSRPLNADFDNMEVSINESVHIWPMPASVSKGMAIVTLARDFAFGQADGNQIVSATLAQAFSRYIDIIYRPHALSQVASSLFQDSNIPVLEQLLVSLDPSTEELEFEVDESYTLKVPDPSNPSIASLQAANVYGALRGLETFSQLVSYHYSSRSLQITRTPWIITDYPRFPYRGLLIDTSRHYQPLESIKRVIDSMSFAKLNVLHWHIVDEEAFPIEIPSYPRLWNGAYSYKERYTTEDAAEIVEYARARGIHVMPELDVPGHGASWGIGYPQLWPSPQCNEPLDVSKEFTFEVIDGILQDFRALFPFKFAHLGGDEVNTSCWEDSPSIKRWLISHNLTGQDAYASFVIRAQQIAIKHGYEPVNWEETFNTFPSRLSKETVVHNWLESGTCPRAVKAGLRCIVSNQGTWYLDHLDVTWDQFYMTEPLVNITDPEEQKLLIGGEVCMWGETVDASDILQTIWPRAAAAAERLWSPLSITQQGSSDNVLQRLQSFRCLLDGRGIAAAPLLTLSGAYAYGRVAPSEPGSCFRQ
ncbi:unnamed protein product [Sphagnum troendelagicum]|uniref:Beta-hexosaminidase n=1 Tax=Sphagnum troendelagicum TaxID=128251 RepID=A0ABP0U730_9BRYO